MLPLAVIIGIRANRAELDRQRNLRLCIERLREQDLASTEFQIILIEQDHAPQLPRGMIEQADGYQFAYNAGPYNRGWAFNIGAKLVRGAADYLLFLDADVLLQCNCLRRLLELLRGGYAAVRPFNEVTYLDRESTERLAGNWPLRTEATDVNGRSFVNPMGLSIAVEAGLYDRMGGYDERFRGWGWEDREFWERLEHNTEIARMADRILHLHHEHSQVKEVWAAGNQALFFESLESRRTVAEQDSKGDVEKYQKEHGNDLAAQFPNARIRMGDRDGAETFQPNGHPCWFSCSIATGPGTYADMAVFMDCEPFLPEIGKPARPLVSVVMPTYYRLHTLLKAVDSLRSQTYSHWELILVDNAGDGNYYFADPRIRVFADAAQRGAAYARNSGLRRVAGDFVCFFDDDDIMYPRYLEQLVSTFIAHPEAGMVRCGIRKADGWDNFSYATPACSLRSEYATPTWIAEHGQDQTYFKTIAQQHGWSVENGRIIVLGEVLCSVGFDMRGGLRRGDL
jgi:glycosyltransferase involved in cell wall biosynthesis